MKQAYQVVADDILSRIRRGEWKRGEQVPAVRTLETLYPHSRMTLHRALRHLQARGYLYALRGRGTFVKATHVRDCVGVLAGGITGSHDRAPLALAGIDYACAYFKRCGLDARVYGDDPLMATRLPAALGEDLESGRLKGLLTIQSSFTYRHMLTGHWRQHRIPHVDVGSVSAAHRVYVDFAAFIRQAMAIVQREGRRRPMLVTCGRVPDLDTLARRFATEGLRVREALPAAARPMGREEGGFHLMRELLREGDAFDAMIVPDDTVAKGVAQGVMAWGTKGARPILLITLANHGIDIFYPVPVVRLDVDVEAMVITAGDLLMRIIADPQTPAETLLVAPDRETRVGVLQPAGTLAADPAAAGRQAAHGVGVRKAAATGGRVPRRPAVGKGATA